MSANCSFFKKLTVRRKRDLALFDYVEATDADNCVSGNTTLWEDGPDLEGVRIAWLYYSRKYEAKLEVCGRCVQRLFKYKKCSSIISVF